MKAELQKKLFKKYPKLFRQKDLSMKETCMCWGIETGDGWYDLIDNLCYLLQFHIDKNGDPQIEFTQVKEKFGYLRIYHNGANERQMGIIDCVEYLSSTICENCGSSDDVQETKGYTTYLCKECMKK